MLEIALTYLFIAWLTGVRLPWLCQHRAVNSQCYSEMEFSQSHLDPESIKSYQDAQVGKLPDTYFVGFLLFRVLKYISWTRATTPHLYDLKSNNKLLDESR